MAEAQEKIKSFKTLAPGSWTAYCFLGAPYRYPYLEERLSRLISVEKIIKDVLFLRHTSRFESDL
jgi:hypothetical protein